MSLRVLKGTVAAAKRRVRRTRLVAFDFDGVFTDNAVYVQEDGRELVRCNRGDGYGIQSLKLAGMKSVIISLERNRVVSTRSRKLEIECVQGCTDKLKALQEIANALSLSLDQVTFVGNDVNDIPCLSAVGLPIIVSDAHPSVKKYGLLQTRCKGGHGAVREICDLFVSALRLNLVRAARPVDRNDEARRLTRKATGMLKTS